MQDTDRDFDRDVKRLRDQIRHYEAQIEKEMEKLRSQGDRGEAIQRLEALREEHERQSRETQDLNDSVLRTSEEWQRLNQQLSMAKGNAEGARSSIQDIEGRIRQYNATKSDSLNGFGPNVPAIVADIDSMTWRQKPIGPIGRHVKLKDEKWSYCLEAFFGAQLNSFVVTNQDDERQLQELLKRHRK